MGLLHFMLQGARGGESRPVGGGRGGGGRGGVGEGGDEEDCSAVGWWVGTRKQGSKGVQ